MLFWVTMRGRERTFSKPRDSAMVSRMSSRTLLEKFVNSRPLVGPVAPRFENKGICDPVVAAPTMGYKGFGTSPEPTVIGDVPTLLTPPTALWPLPQPRPSC